MARYLLDANILSALLTNPYGGVAAKMAKATGGRSGQLCTSVIVAAEVHYGLKKKSSMRFAAKPHQLLASLDILPLGLDVIDHYARIRVELERAGRIIGANDLLIAAHTVAADSILVTNNIREFARVKGLRIENWLENGK